MAILKGVQLDPSSTISFGDRELASDNLLNFDLDIAPETLEIQIDDPTAGHGTAWLWTWETSSLPYARTTITNQPQPVVPLYRQGVYQINNYASNVHGDMTQTHSFKLKWVEGAGDDNLISWVNYSTVVDSHPDINSGNNMTITRLTVNVPSTITPPTLVAPNNISYFVENMGFGAWSFVSDPNNQAFTGTNHGHNVTLGPWYRGGTYTINVNANGHPFYLTTDNGGNYVSGQYVGEYTDGVTGSRTQNGTLTITVPSDAPDTLYYQCGFHSAMGGAIRVQDLEVQTNVNGNYIIYGQHGQERHAQQIELRPIPAMVNQMCLVYDQVNDKFVPQDLATYVENTPSFKNKIQEVAGTAELVVEDGSAVVGKVTVYYDVSYLPILGNNPGDMAFATDTNILYIWDGTAWQQAGSTNADDLTEGNTNFFYTDAKVDARLASRSINSLSDVDTVSSAPSDGQALLWNNANSEWVPGNASQSKQFITASPITAGQLVFLKSDGKITNNSSKELIITTLDNPNPYGISTSDLFGWSVSITESYAIVGTYSEDDAGGTNSGKAYIYDNSTGNLLYTLDNPNPYGTSVNDRFGWSVSITESYAIVGAYREDDAGGTDSGKAYIYDNSTGNLLYTLDNPNAYDASSYDNFGYSVSISESYAIVGAPAEDDAGGVSSGKAYIYSTSTGNLLYTLDNPNAYNTSISDNFGLSVAICESYAIVSAFKEDDAGGTDSGKAYIYDNSTGNLLYTLDNPNAYGTSASDRFGQSISISESYAIVGAYVEGDAGGTNSGKAYIFSTSTGNLLYTLDNPNPYGTSGNDFFGWSVSISESHAIVGAYKEDDAGGTDSGKAYIYSTSTGNLLYTLDNPNAYDTSASDYFGYSVSITESHAIVGVFREDDAGGPDSGKSYIISNLEPPTWLGIAAENISDGASGNVNLPGEINDNQTSLKIGSLYYRDANNQLTTNQTTQGLVGKAISSTELQILDSSIHEKIRSSAYAMSNIF